MLMKTFGSHTGARRTDPSGLRKTLMDIFMSAVTVIFGIRQITKIYNKIQNIITKIITK